MDIINSLKTKANVNSLLWLALILALLGSLRHVASTFAMVGDNTTWGLVQALAIDLGLVAIALSIAQRRRNTQSTKILWLGIFLFSAISIYANLVYGLQNTLQENETLPPFIESALPYILSATLPVLVIYLSEIVAMHRNNNATDCNANNKSTMELQPTIARPKSKSLPAPKTAIPKKAREQRIIELATVKKITITDISQEFAISQSTASRQLSEMAKNNKLVGSAKEGYYRNGSHKSQ